MTQQPSRDAILDAAEQLFARQGFAATTIKQIGAEAGVNTALLYYYFRDKETLYREVLQRLLRAFAESGVARLDAGTGPEDMVRRFIAGQLEFVLARPHLPRLIGREMIDHQATHAEEQIVYLIATLFAKLCDVIRGGQSGGVFRADLEPRFAAISTVALLAYPFLARPAVGIALGEGIAGPSDETMRAYARQAAEYAVAALRAPARPSSSAGSGEAP